MTCQSALYVNWHDFDDLIDRLYREVLVDGAPQVIIAIQRGGLIPGVCLSHRLATRTLIPLLCIRTTSDNIEAAKVLPIVGDIAELDRLRDKDVLLVDDIVGSGDTLRAVNSAIRGLKPSRVRSLICFLNRNNWISEDSPEEQITYLGEAVSGWVVFPWERPTKKS